MDVRLSQCKHQWVVYKCWYSADNCSNTLSWQFWNNFKNCCTKLFPLVSRDCCDNFVCLHEWKCFFFSNNTFCMFFQQVLITTQLFGSVRTLTYSLQTGKEPQAVWKRTKQWLTLLVEERTMALEFQNSADHKQKSHCWNTGSLWTWTFNFPFLSFVHQRNP